MSEYHGTWRPIKGIGRPTLEWHCSCGTTIGPNLNDEEPFALVREHQAEHASR